MRHIQCNNPTAAESRWPRNGQMLRTQQREPINHATGYGRIAFAVPTSELKSYQENALNNQYKILTPFVTLDTPGKASVSVVIFADPDGHEICFVGDKEFRELSQFDPSSEKQLDKYIVKDEARKLKH
ncbi:PREDICTED: glyoxalase domain-containing protein 4-like [Diuraphis noxia]|uniref:glyoxalase domain-containing protein 4-like n=1 Tax=Diuraphis noxia TaxID=143948 RepID=UPI000763816D|nr:PREDICTED: glyoxalase domain-containing protein 4-like [Diuraphis noxia]